MEDHTERLEGFVVDLACVRKYPERELLARAQRHTRGCALMGHCVESGYALVDDDGHAHALDSEATPRVVRVLQESARDAGIRLVVERSADGGEMKTTSVAEMDEPATAG